MTGSPAEVFSLLRCPAPSGHTGAINHLSPVTPWMHVVSHNTRFSVCSVLCRATQGQRGGSGEATTEPGKARPLTTAHPLKMTPPAAVSLTHQCPCRSSCFLSPLSSSQRSILVFPCLSALCLYIPINQSLQDLCRH